jgi:hypothetical protein
MYKISILIFFILVIRFSMAQKSFDEAFSPIRAELTSWDPVRGEWLASSIQAYAGHKEIPDRTFPEDFTPYEMLALVPEPKRKNIQEIITQNAPNLAAADQANWNQIQLLVNHTFCSWIHGRSYGDPHLVSFDNATYSFQTVGEFVLAKSKKHLFEIQSRQRPQNENFSLNSALAMNVGGDRLCFFGDERPDGNPRSFRLNGEPIELQGRTYYLPKGGVIRVEGKNYIVNWPSGERIVMDKRGLGANVFVNVSVSIFRCDQGIFEGLLGNANGNMEDDFNQRNASRQMPAYMAFSSFGNPAMQQVAQQAEREYLAFLAKDFADEWRVSDITSLFDYGFGQSTVSFTDRSFPRVHYTVADLSPNQQASARQRCVEMGIPNNELGGCMFDFGHLNITPNPMPTPNNPVSGAVLNKIERPRLNNNQYTYADGKEIGNGNAQPIANPTTGEGKNPVIDRPKPSKEVDYKPVNVSPKPKTPVSTSPKPSTPKPSGVPKSGGTVKPGGVKIGKG